MPRIGDTLKKMKQILTVITAAAMLAAATVIAPVSGARADAALTALEDKLAAATAQREAAEQAVTNARGSYADAVAEKKAIDAKLVALEGEIDALVALIAGYNAEIASKNADIAQEEQKIADQYEIVRQRIRQKREDGSGDFLTVLLESDGLVEFFTRIDRFGQMLSYDKQLLSSYRASISTLEGLRDSTTAAKAGVDMQVKSLELRRSELSRELTAATKLVTNAQKDIAKATKDLDALTKIEEQYAEERKKKLAELQASTNAGYVGGEFMWPLPESYQKVTSGWGWRIHPVTGKQQFHNGIDIPAPYGTEIYAVNAGTVVEVSYNAADGYYVTVSHGGGLASFYSHLSRSRVKVGDKVKRGQVIANVGTSGYVTGAHLNLNVYKDGSSVNPLDYFG